VPGLHLDAIVEPEDLHQVEDVRGDVAGQPGLLVLVDDVLGDGGLRGLGGRRRQRGLEARRHHRQVAAEVVVLEGPVDGLAELGGRNGPPERVTGGRRGQAVAVLVMPQRVGGRYAKTCEQTKKTISDTLIKFTSTLLIASPTTALDTV